MTTIQVALKGLERCLAFTQEQHDSNVSFYSKRVEQLKQIRDLSSHIALLANEALVRVGEDVPDVRVASCRELEISSNSILAAIDSLKIQISNIANLSANQQVVVQVNSKSIEADNKIINSMESCTHVRSQLDKSEVSKFIKDFKSVTSSLEVIPNSLYSSSELGELGSLCAYYFNSRYGKNSHCIFKVEEFRNYLLSFIIAYSNSVIRGESRKFLDTCVSWVQSLKIQDSKYTLPKPVAVIYFNHLNPATSKDNCYLTKSCIELSKSIWREFWVLGYNRFDAFDYPCLPDSNLNWISEILESRLSGNVDISNQLLNSITTLSDHWSVLHKFETYKHAQKLFPKSYDFSTLDGYKLLMEYVKLYGIEGISELECKLANIFAIFEHAEFEIQDPEKQKQFIQSQPVDSLELFEVLDICESVSD